MSFRLWEVLGRIARALQGKSRLHRQAGESTGQFGDKWYELVQSASSVGKRTIDEVSCGDANVACCCENSNVDVLELPWLLTA